MSTYYYLVCNTHKKKVDAASRTAGGHCPLGDSDTSLIAFIIDHCGCDVEIISEHDKKAYSEEYKEFINNDED